MLGNLDATEIPYTGRYTLDEGMKRTLSFRDPQNAVLLDRNLSRANTLMTQAQAAAKAGNLQEAQRLRSEADSSLSGGQFGLVLDSEQIRSAFSFREDPNLRAAADLSSPSAQILGKQLKDARAYQDWDSQESKDYRIRMSEEANRALAASERTASRTSRDFRASGGAAMAPYAQQAVAQRVSEGYGAQKAQVAAQTAMQFEEFRRQFGRDVVGFSQDWLQNVSGVRESYQSSIDALKTNGASMFQQTSLMHERYSQQAAERYAKKNAAGRQIITAVASIALSALTFGIGGALVAAGGAAAAGGSTAGRIGGALLSGVGRGLQGGAGSTYKLPTQTTTVAQEAY